ncbi:MAG: diaminopimelate decarboxylase [Clostridia bacterium]|nr:diaminopimelate decarboxylase [Clostridia bacterium]
MIHNNLTVGENGHLMFSGMDTVELAHKYGTPLMLLDEDRIRSRMRTYISAMQKHFGEGSKPLLASKALCFKGIYKIAAEEGMGTDIVSPGELYTAKMGGFPLENAYFHGNNKTDADIEYAIDSGIGYFIVDNKEEFDKISSYAGEKDIKQKILVRLSPGIDPHTHAKISTGSVDSKFGTAIETGQAEEFIAYILKDENTELCGYHCHVGSQIFESEPFCDAADIMMKFSAEIGRKYGFYAKTINLGGGFGVAYTEKDPVINYEEKIAEVAGHIKNSAKTLGIDIPQILMEPGRSIVADSGLTLYTVGSVKTITGYKSYISVDGGMPDNPRYALYNSEYTVLIADRAGEEKNFTATIAGRCCESGDLIGEEMPIQRAQRGDILAVLVTGAYNYSMASNYNKLPRPPIVAIKGGVDRVVVRRETFEDMAKLDV